MLVKIWNHEKRTAADMLWSVKPGWDEYTINQIVDASIKDGICIREIKGKRTTWRVVHNGVVFYVKYLYNRGIISRAASLVRSRGKYEFNILNILSRLKINVPDCIAYGRGGFLDIPSIEVLITKEVVDSHTLYDFLGTFKSLPRKDQKKIVREFASFIRDLHNHGVIHSDLHCGNILVRTNDETPTFYLLDFYEVKVQSGLEQEERCRNLALLNLNFFIIIDASLRYYFFKHYISGIISLNDSKDIIRKIEALTFRLAGKYWRRRKNRCMQDNKFFQTLHADGFRIHSRRGWDYMQSIFTSPDSYLAEDSNIKILKDGNTVRAAMVKLESGPPVFLKRYNYKGFFYALKNIFRSSRALRVWKNSYGFELRSISIPSPVACMEQREWRILKRSYVISEYLTDTFHLNSFLHLIEDEGKMQLMRNLGKDIGRMHYFGAFHGDLKWINILIRKQNRGYKIFLIDLDGSRVKKKLTHAERVKDLGRFYLDMEKYGCHHLEQAFFDAYWINAQVDASYDEFKSAVKMRTDKLKIKHQRFQKGHSRK